MKKFFFILLMAGIACFAGRRAISLFESDIGYPFTIQTVPCMKLRNGKPLFENYMLWPCLQKTGIQIEYPFDKHNTPKVTKKINNPIYLFAVPFIESAEEKSLHQVHTHDLPVWNCLQGARDCIPDKRNRPGYESKLIQMGNSGLLAVPQLKEKMILQ